MALVPHNKQRIEKNPCEWDTQSVNLFKKTLANKIKRLEETARNILDYLEGHSPEIPFTFLPAPLFPEVGSHMQLHFFPPTHVNLYYALFRSYMHLFSKFLYKVSVSH